MRRIFVAWAIALPMFGQDAIKQPVRITRTEKVDFAPGGTIHLNGSYGHLTIEGWDEPRVEIVVTKSLAHYYEPEGLQDAAQRLEHVRVAATRRSDTDLEISTIVDSRNHAYFISPPLPEKAAHGVNIDYQIQVPRNSHLVIHHGVGYVQVGGVTGDIEATGHRGDIVLMLPEHEAYSIDAKSKIGPVLSDVSGRARVQHFVGERFRASAPPSSRRIYLRMGFGGITIKHIPVESFEIRQTGKRDTGTAAP
jgi:hypothetical protein